MTAGNSTGGFSPAVDCAWADIQWGEAYAYTEAKWFVTSMLGLCWLALAVLATLCALARRLEAGPRLTPLHMVLYAVIPAALLRIV